MTRGYALKRLLEHGPLTFPQLREITGWRTKQLSSALFKLEEFGFVRGVGRCKRRTYELCQ